MTIDFGHIKTEWTQTNVPVIQERKVDGIEVLKNPKTEHYRKWLSLIHISEPTRPY